MECTTGQRVRVEFEGTVTRTDAMGFKDYSVLITRDDGYVNAVRREDVTKIIIDPDPAGWPPRPGDIWDAKGHEYYAREDRAITGMKRIFVAHVDDNATLLDYPPGKLEDFRKMNPRLVRRREGERS